MIIVLATHNLHKIRELKEMLREIQGIDFLSLKDFPHYSPPEETGDSFCSNAKLKATDCSRQLACWSIADDSGLVVPALKGAPGIFSARYAGPEASDIDNRKKLLLDMRALTGLARNAYFECCIALSNPAGETTCVTGICEGAIITEERGRRGFGYDSLFIKHGYSMTFGQIDESTKNKISHRRKAFDKLLPLLHAL